jgi:hypothetical protein
VPCWKNTVAFSPINWDWYEMEHNREQANHLQEQSVNLMSPYLQWLLPFLIALFLVIIGLTILPCFTNLFQSFLYEKNNSNVHCHNKGTIQDPTATSSYLP